MRKWTVRAARAVLIGAAFAAIGGGVANADDTSGAGSILGGNQVQVPISVPVNVSGNAIGILGSAVAGGGGGGRAVVAYRNNIGDAGYFRGGYIRGEYIRPGYIHHGYIHGVYIPGGYVSGADCTGCATCATDCAAPPTCTTTCAAAPTCTSCPSACAASCPTTCDNTCTTAGGKVIYMRARAQHAK